MRGLNTQQVILRHHMWCLCVAGFDFQQDILNDGAIQSLTEKSRKMVGFVTMARFIYWALNRAHCVIQEGTLTE